MEGRAPPGVFHRAASPAALPGNSDGIPAPTAGGDQPHAQTVPGPGNGTPAHFEIRLTRRGTYREPASEAPPPVDADERRSGQAGRACPGCGVEVATNESGNWIDNLVALIAAAAESPLTTESCWHRQPQYCGRLKSSWGYASTTPCSTQPRCARAGRAIGHTAVNHARSDLKSGCPLRARCPAAPRSGAARVATPDAPADEDLPLLVRVEQRIPEALLHTVCTPASVHSCD